MLRNPPCTNGHDRIALDSLSSIPGIDPLPAVHTILSCIPLPLTPELFSPFAMSTILENYTVTSNGRKVYCVTFDQLSLETVNGPEFELCVTEVDEDLPGAPEFLKPVDWESERPWIFHQFTRHGEWNGG